MGGKGSGGWNAGISSEKTQSILSMRRQGKSLNELSAAFNISKGYAGQLCRKAGLGGKIVSQVLSEKEVADYVSRSGFDYVGGYTRGKADITVRCRDCGRTFKRLFHVFRDVANGTWNAANECPLCREDKQKQKRIEQEELAQREAHEKAQQKAQQKAVKDSRSTNDELMKRLAIHVCKSCGQAYSIAVTGYNSTKYCSEDCQHLKYRRAHDQKRVRRMFSKQHDSDITLPKLYERDGGICHICGGQCDWNDYIVRSGTFVAGPKYPSKDHVIPLAKGGLHVWENVKLAHFICNARKGDTNYSP